MTKDLLAVAHAGGRLDPGIRRLQLSDAAEAFLGSVDHVGRSDRRRATWEQSLREFLDIDVDLDRFLREQLDGRINVVSDSE